MANTVTVVLNSSLSKETLAERLGGTSLSDSSNAMNGLIDILSGMVCGADTGSVKVLIGKPSVGTVTVNQGAVADGDTVVVGGTTLTCVTSTVAASQFAKGNDNAETVSNLCAAINAQAVLKQQVSAHVTGTGGVEVRSLRPGSADDAITLVETGSGFTISGSTFGSGSLTATNILKFGAQ